VLRVKDHALCTMFIFIYVTNPEIRKRYTLPPSPPEV
jgi:hypothetical protein